MFPLDKGFDFILAKAPRSTADLVQMCWMSKASYEAAAITREEGGEAETVKPFGYHGLELNDNDMEEEEPPQGSSSARKLREIRKRHQR